MNTDNLVNESLKSVAKEKKTAEQAYNELLPELQQQLDTARKKGTGEKGAGEKADQKQ